MNSMQEFLQKCLLNVDIRLTTKADLRKMYEDQIGLEKLSKSEKTLFSQAVDASLLNFSERELMSQINAEKDHTNHDIEFENARQSKSSMQKTCFDEQCIESMRDIDNSTDKNCLDTINSGSEEECIKNIIKETRKQPAEENLPLIDIACDGKDLSKEFHSKSKILNKRNDKDEELALDLGNKIENPDDIVEKGGMLIESSGSENEPLSNKIKTGVRNKVSKKGGKAVESSDSDEPLSNLNKASVKKRVHKKAEKTVVTRESEDESLSNKNASVKNKVSEDKIIAVETSDSEDKPLSNINKSAVRNKVSENEKRVVETSDSEDEPLSNVNKAAVRNKVSKIASKAVEPSDSEDEPLSNINKSAVRNRVSEKAIKVVETSESEEEESLSNKSAAVKNKLLKKARKVIETSDSEDEPLSNINKAAVKNKGSKKARKVIESSDSESEHISSNVNKAAVRNKVSKKAINVFESSESEVEPLSCCIEEYQEPSKSKGGHLKESNKSLYSKNKAAMRNKVSIKAFKSFNSSESEDESLLSIGEHINSSCVKGKLSKKSTDKNKLQTEKSSRKKFPKVLEKVEKRKNFKDDNKLKEVSMSSDSENEPLSKKAKLSLSNDGVESSDDEALISISKNKASHSLDSKNKTEDMHDKGMGGSKEESFQEENVRGKGNGAKESSDSDQPLSSFTSEKKSEKGSISKTSEILSSEADSENESMTGETTVEKSVHSKDSQKKRKRSGISSSESEDEPLCKYSKSKSDDEDAPLRNVSETEGKKSNSGKKTASTDEESAQESSDMTKVKTESRKENEKGKKSSASEKKLENLKKYLRTAGIRVASYPKLFGKCESMKAKCEKLLDLLEKEGLKGRPTLEKCKKLRKKIETRKEFAELDKSNILASEGGRSKRSAYSDVTNLKQKPEASTAVKKFSRLQGIIDSEESD